jgi:polyketide synthase PksJ
MLNKRDIQDIIRLTSVQEGMLFHYLKNPGSDYYFEQLCLEILGHLDINAFEKAWNFVVQTNEMLRTVFRWEKIKNPSQIILRKNKYKLKIIYNDLTESKTNKEERLEDIKARDRDETFDLRKVPFRVVLCRDSEKRHFMIISHHHILYDGWSTGIILKEFFAAYGDISSGRPPIEPVKSSFKDFVRYLQDQDINRSINQEYERFWREYLDGFDSRTEVTVKKRTGRWERDWDSDGTWNSTIEEIGIQFSGDFKDKLERCVQTQKVTLAALFYTAWGILLHRYNNSTDVVFGTTVSGRSGNIKIKGIEDIVGLFINTIPLRVKIDQGEGLEEIAGLLRGVNQMLQAREAHENTSLVKIREYSQLDNKEELFDSIVTIENYPLDQRMAESSDPSTLTVGSHTMIGRTHYELTVNITIFDTINIQFSYDIHLFTKESILRLSHHFSNILKVIIGNPECALSSIEMISSGEKQQILFDFNSTEVDYPGEKTIHGLFEEQAVRSPENTAVIDVEQLKISYGELNRKAEHWAYVLRQKGVVPGTIVGILIERSIEMIIGILGILKAGAAYLPLSIEYPEERIKYILEDSNAKVLLVASTAQAEIEAKVRDSLSHRIKVIAVSYILSSSTLALTCKVSSADLAYVIFTSGSTGHPKGVLVEHHSVINRLKWMQKRYPIGAGDLILQKTPYTFDVSVWELLWWAFEGAGVCLLKPGGEKEPDTMVEAIDTHSVTVMHFVPSMLQVMLEYVEKEGVVSRLKSLRQVFASGEKLEIDHVKRFNRLFEQNWTKLINLYGPTEATVDVSYFNCWDQDDWEIIPIGKPIDNIYLYIFDQAGHLTPIGVPGELCIYGVGVARGYLNRLELTVEKFDRDLWDFYDYQYTKKAENYQTLFGGARGTILQRSPHGRRRLYKTGDLACWLADGNIEFLGRIDQQVKIRGFRIELGEIESHLLKHEAINDAFVLFKEDTNGNQYLWGYIVSREELNSVDLKEFLLRDLPDYMVPAYFIRLERIPLTTNGKVDRRVLETLGREHELASGVKYVAASDDIEKKIVEIWSEVLGKDKDIIGIHDNFFDIGGNSLHIIRVNSRLKEAFQRDIPVVTMFNYPTITSLSRYLSHEQGAAVEEVSTVDRTRPSSPIDALTGEVAVIGMAGRFPGAKNIDEYWENLWKGVESITFFSGEQFLEAGGDPELLHDSGYVRAKGALEADEYFDAAFFGYTPNEASVMDPQMRLFHECAWEALENAGYNPESYNGLIGLYGGATQNPYWEILPIAGIALEDSFLSQWESIQFSDKDYLCARVSYKLNLKGPVLTIQTACSTSLAAIDLACFHLLTGRCDMALAGGVSITFQDRTGYLYQEGMIMSPDGHCRAFDAKAGGTVGGNGVGIVVLKPLKAAARDRDFIHAVIKGSATNNDGTRKVGFTAPSIEGQVEVIRAALQVAAVEPNSIGYIEAHGTGTSLGDPIEVEALKQAFQTCEKHFCAVGSVKTNVGHLDAAAGAASFIKAVLAVKHGIIPPSLNFDEPNPAIDFDNSPFYVNTVLKEWTTDKTPRRAGVSSFGIGGTNVHVILEEAPVIGHWSSVIDENKNHREYQLFLLSAKTPSALDKMSYNLADYFRKTPNVNPADAAYTLQVGRQAFSWRSALVCSSLKEAVDILFSPDTGKVQQHYLKEQKENPGVVFMFSGQGAQYINMGLGIYRSEPVFRDELGRCFEVITPILGVPIKEILYPSSAPQRTQRVQRAVSAVKIKLPDINQTEITQPIIFAFEYALASLLMKWGIQPDAMIGHSIGEYVAACLSGVLSLEDALKLVVLRGKLMQRMPPGSMLSIPIAEEELKPLLKEFNADFLPNSSLLSLAAVNSFSRCVVSGANESILAFARHLEEKGYQSRMLNTSHAFHSEMMEPVLEEFTEKAKEVTLNKPSIPYISNISGRWITEEETTDPGYWAKHMRAAVRFADGITQLLKKGNPVFLEVGPGKTLSTFVRDHENRNPGHAIINLVRHPREETADDQYLLGKIGSLWLYGRTIDWLQFHSGEARYRVPLPTYPFESQRYLPPPGLFEPQGEVLTNTSLPVKNPNISEWFYVPVWKQSRLIASGIESYSSKEAWLIFEDETGLGAQLVNRLVAHGQEVVVVRAGEKFNKENHGIDTHTIRPWERDDYKALLELIHNIQKIPAKVIHLWSVTDIEEKDEIDKSTGLEVQSVEKTQQLGFYSLLYLMQALDEKNFSDKLQIYVISNNMQEVIGGELRCAEKATLLGAVRVIPLEFPNIRCRSIDIVSPHSFGGIQQKHLVDRLLEEFNTGTPDSVIAYRGNYRWVQIFEHIQILPSAPGKTIPTLREKGVYLLTGGFGGIGFVLARYLAEIFQARLILTSRRTPSLEEQQKVRELESLGSEVLVCSADVSLPDQVEEVLQRSLERFGGIHGIIHAAGIADYSGVIPRRTREQSEVVLAPKVKGTLVLDELLTRMNIEPDFFVLCSSISSIIAPFGQVAYASANAFLDTFAHQRQGNSQRNTFFISINWDTWQTVGMAEEAAKHLSGRSGIVDTRSLLEHGVLPEEGIEVFTRILHEALPQVIVSTSTREFSPVDINAKEQAFLAAGTLPIVEYQNGHTGHQRPEMTIPYSPPSNEQETQFVQIFQEFFGFEKIGIHDDFFELGGDSLKAMTLLAKIRKTLQVDIPLPEFFNKPTIKELAAYIYSNNRIDKGERIHFSIMPVEKKCFYALSSSQKRLYILQQMEKNSVGYNMPTVMELEGVIDKDRFEDIFLMLMERHETLRTSFKMMVGEPVQKVHDVVDFGIEHYNSATENNRVETERVINNFIRPFELSKAPLLRVGLIKIGEKNKERTQTQKHILMVDMHHIITDGISNAILIEDFMALYQDRGLWLSTLMFQYKDYAAWQSSQEGKTAVHQQEKYWLKEFAGEIPVLNIPLNYERPLVQSFEGSTVRFQARVEEVEALNHLALKEGVTLYMVLLTLYNVLLSKLSGQEDIVIGTPVGGRWHADLEQVMGAFVNTLTLRNFPGNEKTFRGFLQEVKKRTLEAFENQNYPFEDLVDRVAVARDVSRNPIFDAMFALQKLELSPEELPGKRAPAIKLKPYDYEDKTSKFDLTLTAYEMEETLSFSIQYCKKLFKRETIERFSRYFKELIVSAIGSPGLELREMDLLPEVEKRQVLDEFNDTGVDYSHKKTIHQLFEDQVERTPDRIAVVGTVVRKRFIVSVTYRELNQKSNQLAHLLRDKGVRPGLIVGIMVERSVEMIIGLIGILKTGGAYLPIDPMFPEERIKYMLAHSSAGILVSELSEASKLSGEIEGVKLSELNNKLPTHHTHLTHPTHSTHLCYIIYTSGSTGSPKGVMVTHRNVVNFITGMASIIDFSPGKRILALTTVSFDIFFLETLLPLTLGLSVVVADENQQADPKLLEDLIVKHEIDMMQVTPSRLKLFMDFSEDLRGLEGVKELMVGGEAFPVNLFTRVMGKFAGKIHNMYGPTETTIWSAVKDLTEVLPEELTIGTPIANTQVYIINRYLHVQPVGVAGELLIGGDGVAAGYLNNVELTAEKFIDFHYSITQSLTQLTIYRTGDLARWLPNGEIEFLGRLDHQVKIRGYRIELAEIEELLVKHEGVQAAVIVSGTNSFGDKFLSAYIVYQKAETGVVEKAPTTTELREYLAHRLPYYMIPSYYVQLEEIPLTPNGKVDRKVLPEPDQSRPHLGATYVAPETASEKVVADIWQEVLQLKKVGIYDNFFDLGGNSLKVIQLNQKLNETFGKDIPVAEMFRNLTIDFLAQHLGQDRGDNEKDREEGLVGIDSLDKAKATYKNTIKKFGSIKRNVGRSKKN